MGYDREDFAGKPVIAVVNTWSEINPCHTHLRDRAESVKRGVWQAGGFPLEVPAISLSEPFQKPSTMLYRNLLAMETEELLRSYPFDGAVLLGGCDKTTPALVMGAISARLPFIFVPAGPMLRASWRGQTLGSGSDVWKYWDELRAGHDHRGGLGLRRGADRLVARPLHDDGHGLDDDLRGRGAGPVVAGRGVDPRRRLRPPAHGGRRRAAASSLCRRSPLSLESFENAIKVVLALGGSTNAVIHLIAMAGRAGIERHDAPLRRALPRRPVLANLRPSGKYLMQDFFEAGGLRGLMSQLDLHDVPTVSGYSLHETLQGATVYDDDVIRPSRTR